MYPPWMVFIILWPAWSSCADPKIVYKFTNIGCTSNPKRAQNLTCSIKAVSWNKAVAQVACDLVLPLRNTSIQFEIFKKDYSNQYHPFLVNVTFNACDIIAKKSFLSYGTLLFKIAKEYTNINHTCPFTKRLIMRDFSIDGSLLPSFPLGFYLFSMKVTEGFANRPTDLVGVVKFYVQAMEMIKLRDKKKMSNPTRSYNNSTIMRTT